MNNKYKLKVAMAAVAAIAAASSAQAQYANGDLLLGFTTPSSTGDLVIDLGAFSTLAAGSLNANGNVGLSAGGLQSELSTLFGGMGGVSFGVVGGKYTSASSYSLYGTVADGAAAPGFGAAGTVQSAVATVGNTIDGSGSPANQMVTDPTQGYGNSWTEQISKSTSTYQKNVTGGGPDSTTPATFTTGSVVEDLYQKVNGVETEVGTITLQSSGEVDFAPVAVPEPATYGLLSGLGVLALAIRRQLVRKSA